MSRISVESVQAMQEITSSSRVERPMSMTLFGSFCATLGSTPLDIRGIKHRALLGYLALSESGTDTRDRIVGLLWSESDEEHARGSLRATLALLRRTFEKAGFDGLTTDKSTIALDRRLIEVDVTTVLAELKEGRVHPLLLDIDRLSETLLSGLEDIDPAFRVWLLARRQALHDRLLRTLEAGLHARGSDRATRVQFAEALVKLDQTHEEACRHLMEARALAGDIAGALRLYKALWNLLEEEYDMEPSPQTQRLVARIKSGALLAPNSPEARLAATGSSWFQALNPGAAEPSATADVAPRPQRLALIVEAMSTEGVARERHFILEGFRHHLIDCLVRFREWQVSAASAPPQRKPGDNAPSSSQYRIQSSAYETGGEINLILSLKEDETDHFVWSERLRIDPRNMFDLQQRIVQRITLALNVQLSTDRLTRLAGQPNLSPELYDRWLVAQELAVAKRRPADWERAAGILKQLIEEAPRFGPAYSSLVQLRNLAHIVHPGVFRNETQHAETLALAKTAVRLDPVDSRSQLCIGWVYAFDEQFDLALLHFGLAAELNDADPWTLTSAAHAHAFAGEFEKSRELARLAREVSVVPSAMHWAYSAIMNFMWGDYEGSVAAADLSKDIAPVTPMWRAASLQMLGRQAEARHEANRFLQFIRSHWSNIDPPSEPLVGRWILQLFPIRRPADRARVIQALAGAGLPVAADRKR